MKTSSNIQSTNENRNQANDLQSVTISRESRDNGNAYGRRTLRNVYYRVEVPHYCDSLYNHSEEAHRKASEAVTAYYSEIVGLLETDGWTLQGSYGNGTAPTMTKDGQELYCHPQEISGNVNDSDTDHVAEVLAQGKTFSHRHTDLYEAIVCTADDDDELALYAQNYDGEIMTRLQEMFTTPRRNLYKDTAAAQWALVRALKIRTDRHKFGLSGSEPVCRYVADKYDQAVAEGWIIEDKGKNGQQIARWLNKAETKAKEKADREKAQQEQEREAATLEATSEITDTLKAGDFVTINSDGRPAVVVRVVAASDCGPAMVYLNDWSNWPTDSEGVNVVCTPDDVTPITSDMLQPKDPDTKDDYKPGDRVRHNLTGREATVTAIRVTKAMTSFGDLRKVYRLDFGQSVTGPFGVELNGGEFLREAFTPCTPDGTETLTRKQR